LVEVVVRRWAAGCVAGAVDVEETSGERLVPALWAEMTVVAFVGVTTSFEALSCGA
jgi:hypothetical protein